MAVVLSAWLLVFMLSEASAQVIIRQYIEGNAFNKVIQLENMGSQEADVSGYVIEEHVNVPAGAKQARYTFPAAATIAGQYTVCNAQASEYLLSVCDDTAAFGINGNDAITLLDAIVGIVDHSSDPHTESTKRRECAQDRIGEVEGTALTGSKWEVSCVAGATADKTLVRAVVSSPPLVPWTTGTKQWDVYPKDTFVDGSNATWNGATGVKEERSPVSTCTSDSPGGTQAPLSPPTATATPSEGSGESPPPPTSPAVQFDAPATGVEDGNSCAAPAAAAAVSDRRADTGALRVATFNTEFLFDGVSDPSASRWRGDPSGATEHLQKLATFIASFQADIINLVEVEGCSNLRSLVTDGGAAELSGTFTGYLRQGTDSATGQDVALLTKLDPSEPLTRDSGRSDYPIPGSGCGFSGSADTGISKNYVAKWDAVRIGGQDVKVAVVALHLKAFPTDARSCAQREGQAVVARQQIQDLASSVIREYESVGYEVIALGDINDFSVDPPDAADSQPTSVVLDMLAGTLPSSVSVPGITTTPRLYNVMEKLPKDQRYTSWFDRDRDNRDDGLQGRENSAIDHILVSQKLWDLVSEVDIIHEAPPGVDGEVLSDHWPVLVTFGTPNPDAKPANNILRSGARCSTPLGAWFAGRLAMMLGSAYFVHAVLF